MTSLTFAPQAERVGRAPPVTVGLSSAEAQRRLTEFGPNEIRIVLSFMSMYVLSQIS